MTLFLAGVFLFSDEVFAVEKKSAENTLCWTRKQCQEQRTESNWPGEGFIQDDECYGNTLSPGNKNYDWGKCLAGGMTTAQVSFGGNTRFSNIGDYIKIVYNYSLIILGILAAVMIVVAGIQYVGSAGSQEMIGSAKKKIVGAVIGLALAYMSYTILGMINPSTVNLRLPQVYLIREISLSKLCKDLNDSVFANLNNFVFHQTEDSIVKFKGEVESIVNDKFKTQCGKEYYDPSSGKCMGNDCKGYLAVKNDGSTDGTLCGDNYPCACVTGGSHASGYMCKAGIFGGSIKLANPEKFVDNIELWWVKKDTQIYDYGMVKISSYDSSAEEKNYVIPEPWLQDYENTKKQGGGYLLVIEVNDTEGVSSIDDDWILDRNSCMGGSPVAGINETGFELSDIKGKVYENEGKGPIEKAELITIEDMVSGFVCNLNIDSNYPDLSDSNTNGFIYPYDSDLKFYYP